MRPQPSAARQRAHFPLPGIPRPATHGADRSLGGYHGRTFGLWQGLGLRMNGGHGPRSRRPPPLAPACPSNARARARHDWVIQRQVNLEEILATVDKRPERGGRRSARCLARRPGGLDAAFQQARAGPRLFLPGFRREPLRMCPRCGCCGRTSSWGSSSPSGSSVRPCFMLGMPTPRQAPRGAKPFLRHDARTRRVVFP